MFSKEKFSEILKKINNTYSNMTDFSANAKFDRTYISKYINQKLNNPPSPKILEKIARASNGITTYENLMRICGYFGQIRGDRLKSCRLNRNLSLEEVASQVGISSRKLMFWENGHDYNMDFETSMKLAQLYDVDPNWLMGSVLSEYSPHRLTDKIDIEGLDEEDIEEINRFVEFLKNKKIK